jgi:hypothetical protein
MEMAVTHWDQRTPTEVQQFLIFNFNMSNATHSCHPRMTSHSNAPTSKTTHLITTLSHEARHDAGLVRSKIYLFKNRQWTTNPWPYPPSYRIRRLFVAKHAQSQQAQEYMPGTQDEQLGQRHWGGCQFRPAVPATQEQI